MATPEERRAAALESLRMRPRTDDERAADLTHALRTSAELERINSPVMHVGGPVKPIILRCKNRLTNTEIREAAAIVKEMTDYPVLVIGCDWEVVE